MQKKPPPLVFPHLELPLTDEEGRESLPIEEPQTPNTSEESPARCPIERPSRAKRVTGRLLRYPDPECWTIRRRISAYPTQKALAAGPSTDDPLETSLTADLLDLGSDETRRIKDVLQPPEPKTP